ncbi:hypothetical protein [Mucilaginibacter sp.]|uniref:hypothetical protein n=1 Tax=Mucilaginibacter sp. TaxID=1882438 RepID=UPI003264FBED
MHIILKENNERHVVLVSPIEDVDFKKLTVKRYFFNWKKLKDESSIFKLTLANSKDILGLIALVAHPEERIEIKLLAVSAENVGKNKQFDRIAGCLIAFAGREAIRKFQNYPALSLIPKTELKQSYIRKYGMIDAGWQLYLEDAPLLRLVKEYLS